MHIPSYIQTEIDNGSLFVINHSGGKDSQAMLALLDGHIPAEQLLVVHAELPEADWSGIAEHIETTCSHPVHYVRAAKTFHEMVERRFAKRPGVPSFPSPSTRQCTSDLKRDPIAKFVRRWLIENPQHGGRVVHCIGIRAQESSARAKQKVWKQDARESKAGRTVHVWHPIFDLTERQVFDTIRSYGQEPHWAYGAGMTRLSCQFCIMASRADLTTAAHLAPESYKRMVELERRTGWTMSPSKQTLVEITGLQV